MTRAPERIFDLELERIVRRYRELHGLGIELAPSARAELIRRGFSPTFGARHLASSVLEVRVQRAHRQEGPRRRPHGRRRARRRWSAGCARCGRVSGSLPRPTRSDERVLERALDAAGLPHSAHRLPRTIGSSTSPELRRLNVSLLEVVQRAAWCGPTDIRCGLRPSSPS